MQDREWKKSLGFGVFPLHSPSFTFPSLVLNIPGPAFW